MMFPISGRRRGLSLRGEVSSDAIPENLPKLPGGMASLTSPACLRAPVFAKNIVGHAERCDHLAPAADFRYAFNHAKFARGKRATFRPGANLGKDNASSGLRGL
jgi:hypothetical protein